MALVHGSNVHPFLQSPCVDVSLTCRALFRRLTTGSGRVYNTLQKPPSLVSAGWVFEGIELMRSSFCVCLRLPVGTLTPASLYPCPPLLDVYESVRSGECPIGLIPQENSIHGSVIESYDILRVPDFGRKAFVRGEVTIRIQHCLITRKGVALQDVKRILSHEQVCANIVHDTYLNSFHSFICICASFCLLVPCGLTFVKRPTPEIFPGAVLIDRSSRSRGSDAMFDSLHGGNLGDPPPNSWRILFLCIERVFSSRRALVLLHRPSDSVADSSGVT